MLRGHPLLNVLMMEVRRSEKAFNHILDILRDSGIQFRVVEKITPSDAEWCEFVITMGVDSDILKTLHNAIDLGVPILGVNKTDGESFLTEVGLSQLSEALRHIAQGRFTLEEAKTLIVTTDRKVVSPAVNEAAIFSRRSATLIEYTLKVNGEAIWTDSSDGVIISTPTGSTAYAMSAGGPMILPPANVFAIVSVNSLDVTRRPLIVPDDTIVRIENLVSRKQCEVIIDGLYRSKINESVEVSKSLNPARLIRLLKPYPTAEKMAKKVRIAHDLLSMPPSAKLMLKILEYEGPLSRKDILEKTMLPDRTASLALSILLARGLVKRRSSLKDGREKVYYAV
jgi:NAD+ kinase